MKQSRRFLSLRNSIYTLVALVALAMLLVLFTGQVSDSVQDETERIARDAISRALITCYAAEGSYPPTIAHLENHYGVMIDHEAYVVNYEILASNVMPEVILVRRK